MSTPLLQIAWESIAFGDPIYLGLLVVPGVLVTLAMWRIWRRHRTVRALTAQRTVPVRERLGAVGDLAFWGVVLAAAALTIVAVARPQARVSAVREASADVVVLQDASASMYVGDVNPDRWRRSLQFLRTFAETLSWRGDRVALALFAAQAAPQVRLTTDPNALMFFLDQLGEAPPFSLENETTWDTNIEEGIRWGLRLVERDEEEFGASGNPKAFVVISDGQVWSGSVAAAVEQARAERVPLYVVGIGTTAGGLIPEPLGPDGSRPPARIRSQLDRESLVQLAVASGGAYYEIGQEPDRLVAVDIVDRLRRQVAVEHMVERVDDLYGAFLMAAAGLLVVSTAVQRRQVGLVWQAGASAAAALWLLNVLP